VAGGQSAAARGGVFVSVTTELLPTGLLPAMSRDLGVSEGRVGLLVTAYALMVAVLAAPIGVVTARYGRRTLLTVALILYAVCNAVTAVSDTYPLTVAAASSAGSATACSGACSPATPGAWSAPTGWGGR
jgi:predicted MFS family arabinose efflux permease